MTHITEEGRLIDPVWSSPYKLTVGESAQVFTTNRATATHAIDFWQAAHQYRAFFILPDFISYDSQPDDQGTYTKTHMIFDLDAEIARLTALRDVWLTVYPDVYTNDHTRPGHPKFDVVCEIIRKEVADKPETLAAFEVWLAQQTSVAE